MDVLSGQPLPAALLQSQLNSGDAGVRELALCSLARAHAAGLDVTSVVGAPRQPHGHRGTLRHAADPLACAPGASPCPALSTSLLLAAPGHLRGAAQRQRPPPGRGRPLQRPPVRCASAVCCHATCTLTPHPLQTRSGRQWPPPRRPSSPLSCVLLPLPLRAVVPFPHDPSSSFLSLRRNPPSCATASWPSPPASPPPRQPPRSGACQGWARGSPACGALPPPHSPATAAATRSPPLWTATRCGGWSPRLETATRRRAQRRFPPWAPSAVQPRASGRCVHSRGDISPHIHSI